MIVRYASAKHDGLEVELFAELLAIFIHTARQSQSAIVGMYEHLNAIEYVAVGIVGVEGLVAGHLGISVVALDHVVVHNDGEGAAHNHVVNDDDHLAFRENRDEFLDLCPCPEHVGVSIDALERFGKLVIVLHVEVAQAYLVNFVCRFHNCLSLFLHSGAKVVQTSEIQNKII